MGLIDRGTFVSILTWGFFIACIPGLMTMMFAGIYRDIYGIRRAPAVFELKARRTTLSRAHQFFPSTYDGFRTADVDLFIESWLPCRNETQRKAFLADVHENARFSVNAVCTKKSDITVTVATIELGKHRFLSRSKFFAAAQSLPNSKEPLECGLSVIVPEAAVPWNLMLFVDIEVIPVVRISDPYPDYVMNTAWSVFQWFADVLLINERSAGGKEM
jgi:hypothetical protein